MYKRLLNPPSDQSFFLFGPRGTGKTLWVKTHYPDSVYLDLLKSALYNELLANPDRLEHYIPNNYKGWVIVDEIQKIPALLDEIHRLMEEKRFRFILTGSSAHL